MNYSNEPRALYALCRCLPWWCVCVYVCVCVQILYSTLVDLNDIALRLFMMGAELNGKKNKIKNRMRNEGVWWRCDRGEEIPVDFVFFFLFFFPLRVSEKETAGWNLIWKHFLACLPSIFIPAPPRSTSSRPLSTFPSRRSLFMLWTANRWAELFRGLNYVVILGFFAFSAPLFFCPRERRHFILVGDRAVLFSARCRRGRKGGEERKKGVEAEEEVETKHWVKTQKVENVNEVTATSQRLLSSWPLSLFCACSARSLTFYLPLSTTLSFAHISFSFTTCR